MSANSLSQKEYLKKYLSSASDDKKKKKKKKNTKLPEDRFRIVDDDIDVKNIRPLDNDELDLYNLAEDAPQIAGIIDERPEDMKRLETFGTKRWKVVADENGIEDIKVTAIDIKHSKTKDAKHNGGSPDSSNISASQEKGKSESEIRKNYKDLNEVTKLKKDVRLPKKSKDFSGSHVSPPGAKRKISIDRSEYDSDMSPPRSKKQQPTDEHPHYSFRKHVSNEVPPRKPQKPDSDESPPRRSRQSDSDVSPPRRTQHRQDSDESPPRKARKQIADKLSPQRVRRRSSYESPPRRPVKRYTSPSSSALKHVSDGSPPRKSRQHQTAAELVYAKSKKQCFDEGSPQKLRHRQGSEQSPHRKYRQQLASDFSTTRVSRPHGESPHKNTKPQSRPLKTTKTQYDLSESSQRKNIGQYSSEKYQQNSVKKHESESQRNSSRKFEQKSPVKKVNKFNNISESPERRSNLRSIGSAKLTKDAYGTPQKSHSFEKYQSRHKESNSPNRQYNRQSISPVRRYAEPSHWKSRQHSPHGRNKSDNDSDASPPRKHSQVKSSSKRSSETDSLGTKRVKSRDTWFDRNKNESRDLSYRRPMQDDNEVRSRRENSVGRYSPVRSKKNDPKMLDGMKAGLQSKEELKKELVNFQEREREMFAKLDPSVSGEGVTAILRDRRTGKRRNLEQEARDREEQEIAEAEQKTKYSRWGRGLKQVEDQSEKLKHDLHEMSKPLARYADDADLERHLRDQEREGDPMLEYIRSKNVEAGVKEKPKYQGSYLPNRFGIPPGHRWDGVDRSSGYEKKWFEEKNARRAREEEAYKWSTSDM